MAVSLAKLGLRVTVVTSEAPSAPPDDLPFAIELAPRQGASPEARRRGLSAFLDQASAKGRFDVTHSMLPLMEADVYQPRGGCALYAERRHAAAFENPLERNWKRLSAGMNRRRRARIADEARLVTGDEGPLVLALSSYVREQFRDIYRVPDERLRMVRNGVDIDRLNAEDARRRVEELRAQYKPEEDTALFLFVAQDFRRKGLRWLLASARRALELRGSDGPRFRILVVGREATRRYASLRRRQGLESTVEFVGPKQEIAAYYHLCDAVVLPTYDDACSRIVLEGLALGKPAITTRFNGAVDFLGDGKYGVTMQECDDVEGLARALLHLAKPEVQRSMSAAILDDHVPETVSMDRHAQELEVVYREVVAARGASHGKKGA